MGSIVTLITELGSFGLLLGLAGFIIYNYIKNSNLNKTDIVNLENLIKTVENNYKSLSLSLTNIETKFDNLKSNTESEIKEIYENINEIKQSNNISIKTSHTKQFSDRLKLGPQLHKALNRFRSRINADHIFIGSFHNGNESLTGIPYYKFDIIAERFRPDKVARDLEFAFMYKDADLLRHDMLPAEVVQNTTVHYVIDKDGNSPLSDIDDIIYRRMIGRDIKQLAVSLLRDPSGTPSGFVGCVRYDYETIDLSELRECGIELEQIYASNDKLVTKNLKNKN